MSQKFVLSRKGRVTDQMEKENWVRNQLSQIYLKNVC